MYLFIPLELSSPLPGNFLVNGLREMMAAAAAAHRRPTRKSRQEGVMFPGLASP